MNHDSMPSNQAFELRWGILSTGSIATQFVGDLQVDPATRDVSDISHKIVAVASRSKESAERFIREKCKGDSSIKALGTYDELYKAQDVDCIYVATPHSHHYENVKAALQHGKNVLLEKPATVNAKQWEALVEVAKEKNVFLMEAVWTRFFPCSVEYQEVIRKGTIGELLYIHADLSFQRPLYDDSVEVSERLVNPKLAGGALLDHGPYPLVHILMATSPHGAANDENGPLLLPQIDSTIIKAQSSVTQQFGGGDIDESTFATLVFPRQMGRPVVAHVSTSLIYVTPIDQCVRIIGTKGQITIPWPPFAPKEYTVKACKTEQEWGQRKEPSLNETKSFDRPGGISGMAYEADEVARCIRDGKKQSDRMPWRITTLTMSIFDEIRRQNQLEYPEEIERVG